MVPNLLYAQLGSPTCIAAQNAVSAEQNTIQQYEQTKNDPKYAGPGMTLYNAGLQQLQTRLAALQGEEEIACSAAGAIQQGDIRPKYMVLTIIYAPPGTTGGKTASYVDYSSGSTLGSTIDVSRSFKTDYSITAGLTVGADKNSASVSLSDEWTEQQTTTDEYKVSYAAKTDIKAPGPSTDGIDHGYDQVWLCLNPIIHVTVQGKKITYTPGIDGNTLEQIYVYVSQLKNPATMFPDVADALKAHGFTTEAYNAILKLDPFANGPGRHRQQTLHPDRLYPSLRASTNRDRPAHRDHLRHLQRIYLYGRPRTHIVDAVDGSR
jgi:hypothetical protein